MRSMNERGEHGDYAHALMRIVPIEKKISSDGIEVTMRAEVLAGSKEIAKAATEAVARAMGAEVLPESHRHSFFAFSSNNWTAKWDPKGPKPNWGPASEGPSRN